MFEMILEVCVHNYGAESRASKQGVVPWAIEYKRERGRPYQCLIHLNLILSTHPWVS